MRRSHFEFSFHPYEPTLKSALSAMTGKGGSKYFGRTSNGDAALLFNGFRINSEKAELLLDGEPVAYMNLPELYEGDTLTLDGRGSMFGKYKITFEVA